MCGHTLSSYFSSCSKTTVLNAVARVSRPSSLSRWRSQACAMASLTYRKPIVLPPRAAHTATVIMLHGLGDSGEGWAFLGPEFSTALPHVKFIFPHAPSRPISLNYGMSMPGWYDIESLEDINQHEDRKGLEESKRYIEELVQGEAAAGVASERVVVGGFSQGGAVALMMLRSEHKLAGVAGLSTYMPLRNDGTAVSPANANTPVFQAHGEMDNVVNYTFGEATCRQLQQLGVPVTFRSYRSMGHSVTWSNPKQACPEELSELSAWLKTVLP